MVRPLREDRAGAFYHVVNRGVERRRIVERRDEHRFFLSLLARGVRRGWLDVLAYVMLGNHYHLAIRSHGHLSSFMGWAMSRYVRRFNRSRERDGPLFKARFWARRCHGEQDLWNVLRYIDANPVQAGLAAAAWTYRFGSAFAYVQRRRGPPWLARDIVQELVSRRAGRPFTPELYVEMFGQPAPAATWLTERRLGCVAASPLRAADPGALVEWLIEASVGQGRARRWPLVDPRTLLTSLEQRSTGIRQRIACDGRGGRGLCPVMLMTCGLLAAACGLTTDEITARLVATRNTVSGRCRRHAKRMRGDPLYAAAAAEVVADALTVTPA